MEGVPAGALRVEAAGGEGPWYLYTPFAGCTVSVEAKKFADGFLDAEGKLNTELVTERRVLKWRLGALRLAEEALAGSRRSGELPSLRLSTTYSRLTPRSGTHAARREGDKMVLCEGAYAECLLQPAPPPLRLWRLWRRSHRRLSLAPLPLSGTSAALPPLLLCRHRRPSSPHPSRGRRR